MLKQFKDTFLLKYKLRKLLKWEYYLYTLAVDYSAFTEFNNKYCLLIQNNKSYNDYYLELEYKPDLSIDEVAHKIYEFIINNCNNDDTDFTYDIKEISLTNFEKVIKY